MSSSLKACEATLSAGVTVGSSAVRQVRVAPRHEAVVRVTAHVVLQRRVVKAEMRKHNQ